MNARGCEGLEGEPAGRDGAAPSARPSFARVAPTKRFVEALRASGREQPASTCHSPDSSDPVETTAVSERLRRGSVTWLLLATLALGCTQSGDGPARIVWDRDTCKACSMVISDPHFAAQVRGGPKQQVFKFDDLGCAMKWLDEQPWADEPATKVWVARHADGEWLDGKTAHYVAGKTSPMGFNFSAVDGTEPGADFSTQRATVRAFVSNH